MESCNSNDTQPSDSNNNMMSERSFSSYLSLFPPKMCPLPNNWTIQPCQCVQRDKETEREEEEQQETEGGPGHLDRIQAEGGDRRYGMCVGPLALILVVGQVWVGGRGGYDFVCFRE